MTENSKIEWCTHTFNPWIGCAKAAIGARFGVSKTLVRRIHQGKAWREFPEVARG